MFEVFFRDTRLGILNDDGTLASGEPVLHEIYENWYEAGAILEMRWPGPPGPEIRTDDGGIILGDAMKSIPLTPQNMMAKLRAFGFTLKAVGQDQK